MSPFDANHQTGLDSAKSRNVALELVFGRKKSTERIVFFSGLPLDPGQAIVVGLGWHFHDNRIVLVVLRLLVVLGQSWSCLPRVTAGGLAEMAKEILHV